MLILYAIWAILVIAAIVTHTIRDNRIKATQRKYYEINNSTCEIDSWFYNITHYTLTKQDEFQWSTRLDFEHIPTNSLLYYLIHKCSSNMQRTSETQQQFAIRLMKTDFEKNHGISFDKFMNICKDIHKKNPELLI